MAKHEVFEGVEEVGCHPLHVLVLREHEGQLLLEHEHARGDGGDDVPARFDGFKQDRNVVFLQALDCREVPELKLGHAAALLPIDDLHGDVVV